MGVANHFPLWGGEGTTGCASYGGEYTTMGDWGIVDGSILVFEYTKKPGVEDFTPRAGRVEKSCGWGVVLEEDDPMDPKGGTVRYRSYSIYDPHKCRNMVRVS